MTFLVINYKFQIFLSNKNTWQTEIT